MLENFDIFFLNLKATTLRKTLNLAQSQQHKIDI